MSDLKKIVSTIKNTATDISDAEKASAVKAVQELKKIYDKQQGSGRRMKGRGFIDWIKGAFSDANQWLKDNKILSKVASPFLKYALPALGTVFGTPVSGLAAGAVGLAAEEGLKRLGYGKRKRKIKGGLSINPVGQRVMGKGMTLSYIGVPTMVGNGYKRVFKGGAGVEFYSPSSEFGKIKA
jgi:hypothetical protein